VLSVALAFWMPRPLSAPEVSSSPFVSTPTVAASHGIDLFSSPEATRLSQLIERIGFGDVDDTAKGEVKAIMKDYCARTGHPLPQAAYDEQVAIIGTILEYKYELGRSALLSWDRSNCTVTPTFTSLREQAARAVDAPQLDEDTRMIEGASRHRSVVTDKDGRAFEFGRETLVRGLSRSERRWRNFQTLATVIQEFGR